MPVIANSPRTAPPEAESAAPVRATRFDPPHEIPRADLLPGRLGQSDPMAVAAADKTAPFAGAASDTCAGQVAAAETNIGEAEHAWLGSLPFDARSVDDLGPQFSATSITPAIVHQFRTQAQQLASHLEARQRDLDHREAQLHAQLARYDADARSARLWFQEQNRKLAQRQEEWERREREIANRLTANGKPVLPVGSSFSVESKATKSPAIDDEIDFRLREAEFHELSAQLEARYHHCDALAKKLDTRFQQLEAAEGKLAQGESELHTARQEFEAQRQALALQTEQQRRQADERQARAEAELSQRRSELDERAAQLKKRSAAVEQLHSELLQIQRETLESQLAAEELRAELAPKAPSPAILQSLARLRANLTQQYRLQADDLERQKKQLVEHAASAAEQERRLAARQRDFESWMIAQQRQLEQQAAQLADREHQFERQQKEQASRRLHWETERRQLETEVRQLQAHIRRLEETALDQI